MSSSGLPVKATDAVVANIDVSHDMHAACGGRYTLVKMFSLSHYIIYSDTYYHTTVTKIVTSCLSRDGVQESKETRKMESKQQHGVIGGLFISDQFH